MRYVYESHGVIEKKLHRDEKIRTTMYIFRFLLLLEIIDISTNRT